MVCLCGYLLFLLILLLGLHIRLSLCNGVYFGVNNVNLSVWFWLSRLLWLCVWYFLFFFILLMSRFVFNFDYLVTFVVLLDSVSIVVFWFLIVSVLVLVPQSFICLSISIFGNIEIISISLCLMRSILWPSEKMTHWFIFLFFKKLKFIWF